VSDAWTKRFCDCQQSQTAKKDTTLQTGRNVQILQRKTQWHEDIIVLEILQASAKVVHSSWSKRNTLCALACSMKTQNYWHQKLIMTTRYQNSLH